MKKIIFNPFEQFSERPLILFGIAATILLSMSGSFFNARFDGVLDLHFSTPTFFINTLTDNVINVVILSLAFFTLGKIRNPKTRFIDVFTASLISRIPYYFLPFFNWNNIVMVESEKLLQQFQTTAPGAVPQFETSQLLILLGFTVVTFLFLAWFIYLLYKGYKVATNAKGGVEIVLFIVVLISAELFSKIIFYLLN
ncbi:YIP1 family protein [Flavobacterium antarcticum]|uniref:YIP1 family protein n=1 Tax=Flavobacterium antarcticum TaxID=271155 RepID=UPI0003B3586C|nr:YIP1 family protein [Flavobacterium antarcticum]